MRVMEIPAFPHQIEFLDLKPLFEARLNQEVIEWAGRAIPLLGYMCYPNGEAARHDLVNTIRSWGPDYQSTGQLKELEQIQGNWLKIADIFETYCGLVAGRHQERRGGPSIGKAVTLVAAGAKSRGTGQANLWKLWGDYKDVAHLVTAAALICREVRGRFRKKPPRLNPTQFQPFFMTYLMPDLVVAAGLEFERVGCAQGSDPQSVPPLDPDTYWRIPHDINVAPLPPLSRKLRRQDKKVLNDRRAGNRGRATRPSTR